jgi:hypothetical protein
MKTKFRKNNVLCDTNRLASAMISALFLLALNSICFGQIYSYTDAYAGSDSVSAYGGIVADYGDPGHVNTSTITITAPDGSSSSSSGGWSASTSIAITADGWYGASTTHTTWCPITNDITDSGQSGTGVQAAVDTCTPCQAERSNKRLQCIGISSTCEAAALVVYNNAMTSCENNNFCNPNSPQFNQEQCDNCKGTANQNIAMALLHKSEGEKRRGEGGKIFLP